METRTPIRSIAVLGAGTMGRGIAQVAAMAGYAVRLYDLNEEILDRAMKHIETTLDGGIRRGKVTEEEKKATLSAIEPTADFRHAVADADLVIEAAPEKLALKQEIFRSLDRSCPSETILATNTSSLSVKEIAEATRRPQAVLGMHFFNPPHIMKLVEVVRHDETAPEVVEVVLDVARRMKKEPIVVRDFPGFATSRLGVALGLEAMRMVEQGVASVEDIDRAMELGYNHPMGPLRLGDLVGLDVRLHIAEYLYEKLGSEVFRPPEILKRMVREGKLGKKTGQGFYRWEET
ncbi:MAG: 3-hydroxyacyl-CoA dehydrogenase family protein [Acidobacteria bacterium]|nr:MAG: 3-hydroxyacyl-CoA dehydrogenase family protein [Acidobacteriota bacterium]